VASLPNVVHDDTLLNPRHLNEAKTGIKQFDYVVSNPPFNMDFSDSRDTLAGEQYQSRFFAGVPNVPNKKKDGMDVYLMFLQHIVKSLGDKGKAGVVVPTGFLTATLKSKAIAYSVREFITENNILSGVVSMPSNIFATTGTNVSILFLDKKKSDDKIILIDASKLGEKVKEDGKNQRTVLRPEEIKRIISTFNAASEIEDFSITVTTSQIAANKYSFSAGQYFDIKIEYTEISELEFINEINSISKSLSAYQSESSRLHDVLMRQMKTLKLVGDDA
jgi:type I restriction enzyme M protein